MTKEEILQGFLSKDAHEIWLAAGKVLHSVITDKGMIESLSPHLPEIRQATRNIDYGKGILSNQRYVEKALKVIEQSKWNECLCEYVFADYGQSVENLQNFGFILLSQKVEREKFTTIGEVECPKCHQRYIVEEEFTGWHMTSSRHRKVN